ncbi:hypothetical protein B5E60_00845 [Alistipes sp. An116]|uniref:hypothetical protein n=1 Tax=Alistipes sp. An116 TaxID=1965546 RepID=UPI000B562F08|nr:hypothetical protein [Alistipes sp. An116]OUQ54866.1 hypothetical protein B5E60_00845 [Alistipes sp. An116]
MKRDSEMNLKYRDNSAWRLDFRPPPRDESSRGDISVGNGLQWCKNSGERIASAKKITIFVEKVRLMGWIVSLQVKNQ